ncbi:MAG: T9SS type A sorting domain-containing protein [Flavobacteriales bacterium]
MTFFTRFCLLALILTYGPVQAQNILYQENLSSPPINSIWNDFGDTLWTGSSGCEQAARGDTSDHNSTNVDFMGSQNSGYFLANNPEDSCGGYNSALVVSDSFDFSGADTLYFSCSYFLGDSLGWGPTVAQLQFKTPSNSFLIDTAFADTGQWSSLDVKLPGSMIDDTVWFELDIGGGEGVGVDDLMVYEPTTTSLQKEVPSSRSLRVYPNPVRNELHVENIYKGSPHARVRLLDMTGRVVRTKAAGSDRSLRMNTSDLEEGVYILEWKDQDDDSSYRRVIKR